MIFWSISLTSYTEEAQEVNETNPGSEPRKVYSDQALIMLESPDLVSCLDSHPLIPNLFAIGSLDKYIRIFDVKAEKIIDWYQSEDYITACSYSPDGRLLVVGFYHGLCRVYKAQPFLLYQCDVICRNSNVKEINANKVINVKFINKEEFLVSSSDSRIRLFHCANLDMLKLKYKGLLNARHMVRADCDG
jgi:WD40 repeat protein